MKIFFNNILLMTAIRKLDDWKFTRRESIELKQTKSNVSHCDVKYYNVP